VQFVDVREPWEYETAKLPHFKLFPLSEASKWADTIDADLDPETETVVLCHHGMRSMQMSGVGCQG
jgi:rhodanese-related sulfurtransferase